MEEKGFYLTVEKTVLANALKLVEDSRALRSMDLYIESFSSLKTAYISIVELEKDADALYRDAISSIYVLILFVTISSSFLSFFLLNTINRQIISSILSSSTFLFSSSSFTTPFSHHPAFELVAAGTGSRPPLEMFALVPEAFFDVGDEPLLLIGAEHAFRLVHILES